MLRHLAFFTFVGGAGRVAAEGGRGSSVSTAAWQSTQHLPSDYVPSAGRASEAMAAAPPAPSPRPTTTTRAKGMTYFQRLAADAEAARQARLERLKAEAKAAEEAGALGLKKGEAD